METKFFYETPVVEVVKVEVEKGFQSTGSGPNWENEEI